MSNIYLIQNRFGLGARADPAESLMDLDRQLAEYDPAPPAIAAQPGRPILAAAFARYAQQIRPLRAGRKAAEQLNGDPIPSSAMERDNEPGIDREQLRFLRSDLRRHYIDACDARLTAALDTPTPFAERLVHFWSNHFAVSAEKLPVTIFAGDYEFSAIRPHVMGTFGAMLSAAVTHPAMLLYLDQAQSVGPDSPLATRRGGRGGNRKPGLNENLAREIFELHTLGVRTGYTQADVTAFAAALTGLTVAGLGRGAGQRMVPAGTPDGDTLFLEQLHQPGPQTVLGRRYGQAGRGQAAAILSDLAAHPATARHIATKLARHFTRDDPPPALVSRLETAFLETGGHLPALYRILIAAPECWQTGAAPFKSPWNWAVSTLRGVGLDRVRERQGAANLMTQMGQPIWRPGSPAGYADTISTWAGSAALMQRVEVASRIAAVIGDRLDARQIAPRLLGDALDAATENAIARADSPGQAIVLLLVSPAFLRR